MRFTVSVSDSEGTVIYSTDVDLTDNFNFNPPPADIGRQVVIDAAHNIQLGID